MRDSIVAAFFTCGMHKEAKLIEWDEKTPWLCSHLKFKHFNFYKISLQWNQSDFSPKSYGSFTAINFFTKWPSHSLIKPKRKQTSVLFSKWKSYRASDKFSLATIFRWNSRKVEIDFLTKNFFLLCKIASVTSDSGNQAKLNFVWTSSMRSKR